MELIEKIETTLRGSLNAEFVRLDDDDGISGFVVATAFENMDTLERQRMIDKALRNDSLTVKEQRQILMIAGLTPLEYQSVGARIRVQRIRELGDGWLEVMLRGGYSDAAYVRGALNNQKGVTTTEPEESSGAPGILMMFRAKGTKSNPLTKRKAAKVLNADPYISVMQNT